MKTTRTATWTRTARAATALVAIAATVGSFAPGAHASSGKSNGNADHATGCSTHTTMNNNGASDGKDCTHGRERDDNHNFVIEDAGLEGNGTCPATLDVDRTARDTDEVVDPATETTLYDSDFRADGGTGWTDLSGEWSAGDGAHGRITQSGVCGFDYTTLLTGVDPVHNFSLSATFSTPEGQNQAGVVFNQSSATTRSGASVVDLTAGGSAIRWGYYDGRGYYVGVGSAPLASAVKAGQAVTISVVATGDVAEISRGGKHVASMRLTGAMGTTGYIGLVTTRAKADYTAVVLKAEPAANPA